MEKMSKPEDKKLSISPEEEKKSEVNEKLDKLRRITNFTGLTEQHGDRKALLEEFRKIENDLIVKGYFKSEEEILKALEERGVENVSMMRATEQK